MASDLFYQTTTIATKFHTAVYYYLKLLPYYYHIATSIHYRIIGPGAACLHVVGINGWSVGSTLARQDTRKWDRMSLTRSAGNFHKRPSPGTESRLSALLIRMHIQQVLRCKSEKRVLRGLACSTGGEGMRNSPESTLGAVGKREIRVHAHIYLWTWAQTYIPRRHQISLEYMCTSTLLFSCQDNTRIVNCEL